jgi:hypothetical protein
MAYSEWRADREIKWTQAERKLARKAFDQAYRAQCDAIREHVKKMVAQASSPQDLWRIHDYLSDQREETDRLFDYRYSVLPEVFGLLLRQGWMKEADLAGLHEDKLEIIKRWKNV